MESPYKYTRATADQSPGWCAHSLPKNAPAESANVACLNGGCVHHSQCKSRDMSIGKAEDRGWIRSFVILTAYAERSRFLSITYSQWVLYGEDLFTMTVRLVEHARVAKNPNIVQSPFNVFQSNEKHGLSSTATHTISRLEKCTVLLPFAIHMGKTA